jgi:transposase
LLAGTDLSLWPRARKLFVDWGYRGLKEDVDPLD